MRWSSGQSWGMRGAEERVTAGKGARGGVGEGEGQRRRRDTRELGVVLVAARELGRPGEKMNNSGMDNSQMASNGSFLDMMNVGFGDMDFATSLFYNLYILDACRGNKKQAREVKEEIAVFISVYFYQKKNG